jgi:Mn2+/Fe2+ NRAMP family transporter
MNPAGFPAMLTPMNKAVSIAILIAGIVLLVFGINAQDSLASNAKEAMTGTPTDKSMWLIVLGLIGIIVGGLNSFFGRSRS